MATYQMLWDCPACGTRKLLGKTHRHCPNCGAVQDASWRYFPAEHEKVAVEGHVFVGVDWICERCGTPNSNAGSHCVNCGDARDGSEADAPRQAPVAAGAQPGRRVPGGPAPAPRRTRWQRWRRPLAIALGVLLTVVAIAVPVLLWSKATDAAVTGHAWQRDVRVEVLRAVSDGTWCDSMPSGAYGVSRSVKQRSTNRIPDGESCSTVNVDNGDGTFSTQESCSTTYREEPVYDDWCDFTIDRWVHDHTATASGDALRPEPVWPAVSVSDCGSLGCTRVGGRRGTYRVSLHDADGSDHWCDFEQDRWAAMAVGSRWSGRKRVVLDLLICKGLAPVEGR